MRAPKGEPPLPRADMCRQARPASRARTAPLIARQATVIYVDVDGVLNIGIREPGLSPLLLAKQNCDAAIGAHHHGGPGSCDESVERLVSVLRHSHRGSGAETYGDLVCRDGGHCADVLVARLAEVIRSAGQRRAVVLSSTWRHPRHAQLVKDLEADISRHLGQDFEFDARTELVPEVSAPQRLRCIGEHLRRLAGERTWHGRERLRVVVLDDLSISPLDGWVCGRRQVSSRSDAEAYLCDCVRAAAPLLDVEAKMVHCYAEWGTASGLRLQVGSGLTADDVQAVRDFLGCETTAPKPAAAMSVSVSDKVRLGEAVGTGPGGRARLLMAL